MVIKTNDKYKDILYSAVTTVHCLVWRQTCHISKFYSQFHKLDGVGPADNRPSTD